MQTFGTVGALAVSCRGWLRSIECPVDIAPQCALGCWTRRGTKRVSRSASEQRESDPIVMKGNLIRLRYSLALAAVLRVGYATSVYVTTQDCASFAAPDSYDYLEMAGHLVETGRFATAEGPEIFRPPGYPLLLSVGLLTPNVWGITILVQIGLSTWKPTSKS